MHLVGHVSAAKVVGKGNFSLLHPLYQKGPISCGSKKITQEKIPAQVNYKNF
jgi:hypothetical protein